jgi:hypothetical protein
LRYSCHISHAVLEVAILLLLPTECWVYMHVPPFVRFTALYSTE